MPFPPSANEIYYVVHAAGMQEYQLFLRFTVASNDLAAAVDALTSDWNTRMKGLGSVTNLPTTSPPQSPRYAELLPMAWWYPESITHGYYRRSISGRPFYLWADGSNHTVFYCETD